MHELHAAIEWLAVVVDVTAVLVMAWGFLMAVVGLVRGSIGAGDETGRMRNLQVVRCALGVKIVFALELMIISDLVETVVNRSLEDLYVVAALVVIRTLISYFLNREIQEIEAELGG
jgi:uncharacterized membrane protein